MPDEPLYSHEIETAVLGAAIIDPGIIIELPVNAEHFYIRRHGMIWDALTRLLARQISPDIITIGEELHRVNQLDTIGGVAYLTQLLGATVTTMNATAYAGDLVDLYRRREWLRIASEIAKLAHNRKEDIAAQAGNIIDQLSRAAQTETGATHWKQYLSDLWDYVDERQKNPKENWGIPTGYRDFDKITGGLQTGELMILSGKPGVGKSMWAMEIAQNLSQDAPGAVYSIEMSGRQVAMRLLSSNSGVSTRNMKSGRLAGDDFNLIAGAIEQMESLPIYMSDAAGHTTSSIRADLARLKALHKVKWFVIDYLLLLGDVPNLEEIQRTQIISRNVKLICRSLNIPGILIHSMNKAGIDSRLPEQTALRGSGQVSYDADLIVFLNEFIPIMDSDQYLSQKDRENMRTVIFGKGRELEDPHKGFHLVKLPGKPTFGDYTKGA